MRPDEHKKKKNAAYKKKHGIVKDSSDKKEENVKKEKDRSTKKIDQASATKPRQQSSVSGSHRRQGARDGADTKAENTSSSDSSSDTENENIHDKKIPSKSFRRREIVSNWQKYDLPPETEEKTLARGEAYEKLLNMTGEAISHFRFKDELAWDDPEGASENFSTDAYSEFFSVNPAELSQSLECLPVHQILGISSVIFPAEQLSSLNNTAENIRLQYMASLKEDITEHTASYSDKSEPTEASDNFRFHTSTDKGSPGSVVMSTSEATQPDTSSLLIPDAVKTTQPYLFSEATGSAEGFAGRQIANGMSDNTPEGLRGELKLQDEDLDLLLNADSPVVDVADNDDNEGRCSQEVLEVTGVISSVGSTSVQTSRGGHNSELAAESADLESWLDSVLGD